MLTACLTLIALVQPVGPPPRVERLDNGLRVVIVEDHTLPLVSVQLWYRVGSAYDDPENPGLCHVTRTILEHRDDAALRLRAAGVRFESRTLRDADYFASVLPPNFLEYVLKIEAERMRPLKTTPEMVATGLAAAARDFGLKPDDPEQLAERQLLAAMFSEHPYQHPPGLVAESLSGLEPDDVDEFLQALVCRRQRDNADHRRRERRGDDGAGPQAVRRPPLGRTPAPGGVALTGGGADSPARRGRRADWR